MRFRSSFPRALHAIMGLARAFSSFERSSGNEGGGADPVLRSSFFLAASLALAIAGPLACATDGSSSEDEGKVSAGGAQAGRGKGKSGTDDPGAVDGEDTAPGGMVDTDGDGTPDTVRGPVRTSPQPLPVPEGFYPRAIQLASGKIIATVVRFLPSQRMGATVFESTDGGVSFREIGAVDDPITQTGLCCGTLYELPRALGAMPKGTLLWSASVGGDAPDQPMSMPVWKSTDEGKTWSFVSKIATARVPKRNGGLWEPEFSMLDDGTLVAHYSDETDRPAHSQKLVEARTSDGVGWGQHRDTVAVANSAHRPGMPVVRRPPGGPFVMSYEICAIANDSCTAFLRTSTDGWTWGDPRAAGARPTTVDGRHFRHAPTLAWAPAPGNGRFFMVGQVTHLANGAVAPDNGRTIFANTENGAQGWYPIPAPVPVPDAFDNFCPNYSSTLLPLEGGRVGLELASKYDGKACRTYFARGPLVDTSDGKEIADGARVRLVSVQSRHCLDVANGSVASGANVQQWTCNGAPAQAWTVKREGENVTLRSAVSDQCLTSAGGSTTPGADVVQEPCGNPGQSWKLRAMGVDHFELVLAGSGVCLDVAGGSTAPGGNVAQWTCNDLAPQIWHLQRL